MHTKKYVTPRIYMEYWIYYCVHIASDVFCLLACSAQPTRGGKHAFVNKNKPACDSADIQTWISTTCNKTHCATHYPISSGVTLVQSIQSRSPLTNQGKKVVEIIHVLAIKEKQDFFRLRTNNISFCYCSRPSMYVLKDGFWSITIHKFES